MGTCIKAVSMDYAYSKEKEDYVGEVYSETFGISYGFFFAYRTWILRYFSCGKIDSIDMINELYGVENMHWGDTDTGEIYSFDKFPEEDKEREGSSEYWIKLQKFVSDYPKLKDFWPFAVHSDCDGIIKYQEAEKLIPYFDDFLSHLDCVPVPSFIPKFSDFTKDLIKCCRDVVQHKGKLFWE